MTNSVEEKDLKGVTGGAEKPQGFENAKYDIGFYYVSPNLYGINHYITISVTGYDHVDGNQIFYKLHKKEEMYGAPTLHSDFVADEGYLDARKY